MSDPPPPRRAARWLRLAAGELALAAAVVVAVEALARAAIAAGLVPRRELRLPAPLVVKPHPFLAFALREGAVRAAGTPSEHRIGPHGYRGRPLGPKEPAAFRVACVGDSITYGDALGEGETVPEALEAALRARWPRRRVETLNAGVLQYSSAETFAALALRVIDAKPDVVVFLEGANDVAPRLVDGFRADYAHYRAVWTRDAPEARDHCLEWSDGYATLRWLAHVFPARGRIDWYTIRPAPARGDAEMAEAFARSSPEPFARNQRAGVALAAAAGARALIVAPAVNLAMLPRDAPMAACLEQFRREQASIEGAAFLDLSSAFEGQRGILRDPVHLTPEGARRVAARIAAEIDARGWGAR